MAFKLTLAAVLDAAEKALDEGRMQIQKPNNQGTGCYYLRDGFCCAIGAAVPQELAPLLDNNATGVAVGELLGHGKYLACDPSEQSALEGLQGLHDCLIRDEPNVDERVAQMRSRLAELRAGLSN